MIQAKQKNLRIFEVDIDDKSHFFDYFEKNYILLKDYLLLLKGDVDSEIKNYLQLKAVCFFDTTECQPKKLSCGSAAQSIIETPAQNSEQKSETSHEESLQNRETRTPQKDIVYFRTIRSGEEIVSSSSITIFGRVNSGSRISSEQNISIFGEIDGVVECEGDFLITQKIGSGHVVFKGEILDNSMIGNGMKKIYRKNGELRVEDV